MIRRFPPGVGEWYRNAPHLGTSRAAEIMEAWWRRPFRGIRQKKGLPKQPLSGVHGVLLIELPLHRKGESPANLFVQRFHPFPFNRNRVI